MMCVTHVYLMTKSMKNVRSTDRCSTAAKSLSVAEKARRICNSLCYACYDASKQGVSATWLHTRKIRLPLNEVAEQRAGRQEFCSDYRHRRQQCRIRTVPDKPLLPKQLRRIGGTVIALIGLHADNARCAP